MLPEFCCGGLLCGACECVSLGQSQKVRNICNHAFLVWRVRHFSTNVSLGALVLAFLVLDLGAPSFRALTPASLALSMTR